MSRTYHMVKTSYPGSGSTGDRLTCALGPCPDRAGGRQGGSGGRSRTPETRQAKQSKRPQWRSTSKTDQEDRA